MFVILTDGVIGEKDRADFIAINKNLSSQSSNSDPRPAPFLPGYAPSFKM